MQVVSDFPGETMTQKRIAWCRYALEELGLSRRETSELLAEIEGLTEGYARNIVYINYQGNAYRRPEREMKRGNKKGWYEARRQRLEEEAQVESAGPSTKEIVQEKGEQSDEFVY